LTFIAVLAVAIKAVFRKDRADVSIEIDRRRVLGIKTRSQAQMCNEVCKKAREESSPTDSDPRMF